MHRLVHVVALAALTAGCPKSSPPVPGDAGALPSARIVEPVPDGGRIDPICDGAALALVRAAVDSRCAIPDGAWSELSDPSVDAGAVRLHQRAKREGDEVVFALLNLTPAVVDVPLRIDAERPELAFSLVAEDTAHAVFELAPPRVLDPDLVRSTSDAAARRVLSSRIRMPPAGSASVRLGVDTRIAKRLAGGCPDGGTCPPPAARLAPGAYVLRIGLLVAGIETGPPARIALDVH